MNEFNCLCISQSAIRKYFYNQKSYFDSPPFSLGYSSSECRYDMKSRTPTSQPSSLTFKVRNGASNVSPANSTQCVIRKAKLCGTCSYGFSRVSSLEHCPYPSSRSHQPKGTSLSLNPPGCTSETLSLSLQCSHQQCQMYISYYSYF